MNLIMHQIKAFPAKSNNYLTGAEKGAQKWGGRISTICSCCAEHSQHAKHVIAKGSGACPQENFENYIL